MRHGHLRLRGTGLSLLNRNYKKIINVRLHEALGKSCMPRLPEIVGGMDAITLINVRRAQTGRGEILKTGNRFYSCPVRLAAAGSMWLWEAGNRPSRPLALSGETAQGGGDRSRGRGRSREAR